LSVAEKLGRKWIGTDLGKFGIHTDFFRDLASANKLEYGERITDGAERELKEETNLEGKATLVAIKHYLVFDKTTNNLVEDKFTYLCRIDNVKGELKCGEEGKYEWVKVKEIKKYVTNHFENWEAFQEQLNCALKFDGNIKVQEDVHYTDKF
jgi:hypothetical protein